MYRKNLFLPSLGRIIRTHLFPWRTVTYEIFVVDDMAEIALGSVGLLGLFGNAKQAIDAVQVVRSQRHDLDVLHTKLENQKVRFASLKSTVTFIDFEIDLMTDLHDTQEWTAVPAIKKTFCLIEQLFCEGARLSQRYGLKPLYAHEDVYSSPASRRDTNPEGRKVENNTMAQYALFPLTLWRSPRVMRKVQWVIKDAESFSTLIEDLRDLMDDLVNLTDTCLDSLGYSSSEIRTVKSRQLFQTSALSGNGNKDAGPSFSLLRGTDHMPTSSDCQQASGSKTFLLSNSDQYTFLDSVSSVSDTK